MTRIGTTGWIGLAMATLVAVSGAITRVPGAESARKPRVSSVHGIEINARHTQGTFAGYSTGSLRGDWLAVVKHTPLSPNAVITGGTLTLVTATQHTSRTVRGHFNGGTITNVDPGSGCTNQTYRVAGNLTDFDGNGTGRFTVTLTHYRHAILGACLSYFAAVTGTLAVA